MIDFGHPDLTLFAGHFAGEARWIDIAGEAKNYRVTFNTTIADGALSATYTHDFFEEGNVTNGVITLRPVTGPILDAVMGGKVLGQGYVLGSTLQYHLAIGGIFIEVTYERTATGLTVRGSSSSNKQGRYICWLETLTSGDA